ncbi:hypothetical protein KP509_01G026100 [Ceratopteris richardii]|uniref:CTLH domain-containing protein n=1 Tax=Ceratopteris richardii TaxID=49495 RepID=A0A8T2VN16_CERRI|nr:hypothetical protein KP509_01G026100 [Ceratopteris richardii]
MDPDPACYENLAIDEGAVRKIILDYLIHNCLQETAEAFVACTGMKYSFDWSAKLDKRKTIYAHAMEGNVLKAIELTNELASDLLQNNEDVLFDLLTLHFVELVRSRNCTGALEFAQKELTSYGNREQYIEKLQDVVTLLAYEEPEKSPVYEFLSMDHRQSVADKLNKLVLTHHQLPATSSLERLVQQVSVVRYCLKQDCGKDGWAPFSLTSFLKR